MSQTPWPIPIQGPSPPPYVDQARCPYCVREDTYRRYDDLEAQAEHVHVRHPQIKEAQ